MIVVGGAYGEFCRFPAWDQLFGSGLRAAVALSNVSPGTTLHTFAPNSWYNDIFATLETLGLGAALYRVEQEVSFEYLHPLEVLGEPPKIIGSRPLIEAAGDVILRFGMIEGDAKVAGRRVVYDPQSTPLAAFDENGSTAQELALIVTPHELLKLTGHKDKDVPNEQALRDASVEMFDLWPSPNLVLLVKDKLGGLTVFTGDDAPHFIPGYLAESYFRIGSGDVMAAAFAHAWGEQNLNAIEAADYAARCLAYCVEGPRLPIPGRDALRELKPVRTRQGNVHILGAGALELQSLVFYTADWINYLGGHAVSNLLGAKAGISGADSEVALVLVGANYTEAELDSIATATSGRPTIVYWPGRYDPTARYYFPNSRITDDYDTALYHALRSVEE